MDTATKKHSHLVLPATYEEYKELLLKDFTQISKQSNGKAILGISKNVHRLNIDTAITEIQDETEVGKEIINFFIDAYPRLLEFVHKNNVSGL